MSGDMFYVPAVHYVQSLATGANISPSRLQRHFRIDYNRAARLLEEMEANGIITKCSDIGVRTVIR